MPALWYRALLGTATRVYYRRVAVVGDPPPPHEAPILWVGLHRNGAVDGMLYLRVAPRATFLVAARLLRLPLARLFFAGIPVERARDGVDRGGNRQALDRCLLHLAAGRDLFVMPEGTSDLGPRHLPFHSGVGVILARALASGVPVIVQPVGIFYDAPDRFRSDATIVLGQPVRTMLDGALSERERVAALMARITEALEHIAVEGASPRELARIEGIAALACERPGAAYYSTLAAVAAAPMPERVEAAWGRLAHAVDRRRLAMDRGAPALSRRAAPWSAAWLAVQAPIVAAGAIVNAPTVVAAWLAARRLADARNTVALWRILVGILVGAPWMAAMLGGALAVGGPMGAAAYLAVTAAAVALYPELRARWPRLRNALRGPRRRVYAADARRVATWARGLASGAYSARAAGRRPPQRPAPARKHG